MFVQGLRCSWVWRPVPWPALQGSRNGHSRKCDSGCTLGVQNCGGGTGGARGGLQNPFREWFAFAGPFGVVRVNHGLCPRPLLRQLFIQLNDLHDPVCKSALWDFCVVDLSVQICAHVRFKPSVEVLKYHHPVGKCCVSLI
ncbi:hypothetical protein E4T56_gene577 [Termitomyces sp. T112]|nr:hypothetical protein E4T56_gene577 [Termitomyces sp. T112]